MTKPYVYAILLNDGNLYIGARYSIKNKGFNNDVEYLSSSKYVKRDNVYHKILISEFESAEDALNFEDFLIRNFECINLASSGKHLKNPGRPISNETRDKISKKLSGRKLGEETKQKMSEANTGLNNPFYGKTHSNEAIRKIKESKKNLSPESRENISKAHIGLFSGSKHPLYNKVVYTFISETNKIEICTMYELRTKYSLHCGHLSNICKGLSIKHKGWKCIACQIDGY